MFSRPSLGWPITLGVVMIVLLVALTVGWIGVTALQFQATNRGVYVAILAVGTIFLVLVLAGVVAYLLLSIKAINLNQRQSNFIDSVTHELKSPIASLKLYLQTLDRRKLSDEQRADFHRFMLEDLQRLDHTIDHMLDAARLDHRPQESEVEDVDLSEILRKCVRLVGQHYRFSDDAINLNLQAAIVTARPIDLEMVFRNLIDNAIKYSGDNPKVEIESRLVGQEKVVVLVKDSGPGIPLNFRRKIFGRFYRLGNELEREQTGTGLGLFIVRTLVRRMRGRVSVRGRLHQPGTVFEVELPGRAAPARADDGPTSKTQGSEFGPLDTKQEPREAVGRNEA